MGEYGVRCNHIFGISDQDLPLDFTILWRTNDDQSRYLTYLTLITCLRGFTWTCSSVQRFENLYSP